MVRLFFVLLCCVSGTIVHAFDMKFVRILDEQPCVYTVRDTDFTARCGTISVPEDHLGGSGKVIQIPFKLVSGVGSEEGRPTVVGLNGGPGMSNMRFGPSYEILQTSNLLLIGFRGVDGSVDLSCPSFEPALFAERRLFAADGQERLRQAFRKCLSTLESQGVDVSLYNPQQTIYDLEAGRKALGIPKVSIISGSFGTRLAQYYAMAFPDNIERMALVAGNPPTGRTVWEPELVDASLKAFTIDNAHQTLASMPDSWMGISLDPARVGIATFSMLFSTDSAGMAVSAFEDAAAGDYSGLALMSMAHDHLVKGQFNWVHLIMMAVAVDYDFERDYSRDFDLTEASFGSPLARLLWNLVDEGDVSLLGEEFRKPAQIYIPTLVISGDLDISTPAVNAENELMPNLLVGHHVVVENAGHYDLWRRPVQKALAAFLQDGSLPSEITLPVPDYTTGIRLSFVAKAAPFVGVFFVMLLIFLVRFVVRKVRK